MFVFVAEPKPVYAQPGQPDVDLPVSPSDAPVPSAAHDDSILRYMCWILLFKAPFLSSEVHYSMYIKCICYSL